MWALIVVSAFGEVGELLLASGIDQSRLGGPALRSKEAGEKPFSTASLGTTDDDWPNA